MTNLLKDLRVAFRKLLRDPALTVISVLALTLGIGLTTMTFSIVYGALYRGLPFDDADRLVHLERSNLAAGIESMEVTVHDFEDWREQQTSFEDLAAFYTTNLNVTGPEGPERFEGARISAAGLTMLGMQPARGRLFNAEDDDPGSPLVALVGYNVWQERFNGDEEIVGRGVRVNGVPATIVGVMPPDFRFPIRHEMWVPLKLTAAELPRGEGPTMEVFGRLRDGVSHEAAALEIASIARRLELEYPATNEGVGSVAKPYVREFMGDENYLLGWVMLSAVFLVLLIACANVANLLLARTAMRTKEVGIRTAMGAPRWRIVGQFLVEALAIAVVGALLGMVIAWGGVSWFRGVMTQVGAPFWIDIRLDGPSLLFVVVATGVAAIFAGALPAWQAARADVGEILKDESRGSSSFRLGRLSRGLVVLEVALSFGLLVGAGLLVKSVVNLNNVDYAFAREDVLTARIGLPEADYATAEDRLRFLDALAERLESVPGARGTALSTALPGFWGGQYYFAVDGAQYPREQDYPAAHRVAVSPGYFRTYGVEPVRGRVIEDRDREGAVPVAVVNESFARRYYPEDDAVGKRVRVGRSDSEEPWRTIVGVVPDMHAGGPEDEFPEAMYLPLAQAPAAFVYVSARSAAGDAATLTGSIREAVNALDRDLPIFAVGVLDERMATEYWQWDTFSRLFASFGLAALLLAGIGLYAVMAFAVSTRTREVGIRMALGAEARDVVGMILRQGLVQLSFGLLLGLGIAVALGRALTTFLFSVQPGDLSVFAAILVTLLIIGIAASVIPAWRATRVDPVEALRYE